VEKKMIPEEEIRIKISKLEQIAYEYEVSGLFMDARRVKAKIKALKSDLTRKKK